MYTTHSAQADISEGQDWNLFVCLTKFKGSPPDMSGDRVEEEEWECLTNYTLTT